MEESPSCESFTEESPSNRLIIAELPLITSTIAESNEIVVLRTFPMNASTNIVSVLVNFCVILPND